MLKAYIHHNLASYRTEIWIVDERPDGLRRVFLPVELVSQVVEPGVAIGPTLSLPTDAGRELLRSLQAEIQAAGIKPPDAGKMEGELEATKKHLDDLRGWFDLSVKSLLTK